MITTLESSYNKETNIITLSHSGKLDIDDAINILRLLEKEYTHLENIYILEISINSSFNFKIKEIPTLLSEVKKNMKRFNEVRHADLVSTPLNTALSFIYGRLASTVKNYNYRPFSTEQAAINWLKKGAYYKS